MRTFKERYSIGEVAKLSKLTTKALRHYDKIGLVSPEVDEENLYRYYTKNQLLHLLVVKKLKQAGLSLSEIKNYLMTDVPLDHSKMIDKKISEYKQLIFKIEDQIKMLKALKESLDNYRDIDNQKSYSVIQKELYPSKQVVFTSYSSSAYIDNLFLEREIELLKIIEEFNLVTVAPMSAYFCEHFSHQFFDVLTQFEIFIPIDETDKINGHIKHTEAFECVSTIHVGSYRNIEKTYHRIIKWSKDNGILLNGKSIEEYIIGPILTNDPNNYVTKIYMIIQNQQKKSKLDKNI